MVIYCDRFYSMLHHSGGSCINSTLGKPPFFLLPPGCTTHNCLWSLDFSCSLIEAIFQQLLWWRSISVSNFAILFSWKALNRFPCIFVNDLLPSLCATLAAGEPIDLLEPNEHRADWRFHQVCAHRIWAGCEWLWMKWRCSCRTSAARGRLGPCHF